MSFNNVKAKIFLIFDIEHLNVLSKTFSYSLRHILLFKDNSALKKACFTNSHLF